MSDHVTQALVATVVIQLLTLAFTAGIYVAAVRQHGKEIDSLKEAKDRHDREIGVIYGHTSLPREVRG